MGSESFWKEAQDGNGRVYYYHTKTGESRWDKPKEFLSEQELALTKHGWKSSKTSNGRLYYYNEKTKESRWELPALPELQEEKQERTVVKEGVEPEEQHAGDYANSSKIFYTPKKPMEEAEKEFIQMLQDNQVDSTWSFSKIISELGASDPRYWMVEDDPLYRQQIFEKYLTNRTEDQLLKEHMETSKFNEAFWKMLESKPQIQYYTRWPTVKRLIADEPIYKHSVVKESFKKKRFLEYVAKLRESHEASQRYVKSQAIQELHDYLENIVGSSDFRSNKETILKWQNMLSNYLFEKNKRYMANKHFKILTHEDVLQEYLKILETVEGPMEEELSALQNSNYTKDRLARDNFKRMLRSPDIEIRANSKWQDVYPLIKTDERFLQMLGTGGSSPLDLFFDVVEEMGITVAAQRSIAQNLLIEKGFEWDKDETINRQAIGDYLAADEKFQSVDKRDIKLIIDQLIQLRREKEQKQREIEERAFEERKHFFKLMLQRTYRGGRTKPKSFEDALEDIEKTGEFKQLLDDNVRKQLFEEFSVDSEPARGRPLAVPNPKKRQLTPTVELDY